MSNVLLYTGGAVPVLWGTAHLFPTGKVVRGFGKISRDNQASVLTMEWIAEAILLIFSGLLVVLMTARFGAHDAGASDSVCCVSRNASRPGRCLGGDRRTR